jgi:pimeloyl-ACP methyl ester carboxylesterase
MRPAEGDELDPSKLAVPTIIGRGSHSRPHHRYNTTQLAAMVPDVELVEVEGAGHGCHFSHPAAFAELLRRAIARPA